MEYKLEVIGFDISGCMAAQESGANRIELCDNPSDGGTTPSFGLIRAARKKLSIELYPIIRPRGGDFLYSEAEFQIMLDDIRICKELGCDGIVMGILNADGSIDTCRCKQITDLAYPLGVTFHRAFDRVNDARKALEDIIEIGCERILTSGLKPTAMEGADTIARLIKQADDRIIIMPGSGVRSDNIKALAEKTGAIEFHSSARIFTNSIMKFSNVAMNEKLKTVAVDKEEVIKMSKALRDPERTV